MSALPWSSWIDYIQTLSDLSSDCLHRHNRAQNVLNVWRSRSKLPHYIESLSAVTHSLHLYAANNLHSFRLCAASTLVRLVNGFLDPLQLSSHAKSLQSLALNHFPEEAPFPLELIELRHFITHQNLPPAKKLLNGLLVSQRFLLTYVMRQIGVVMRKKLKLRQLVNEARNELKREEEGAINKLSENIKSNHDAETLSKIFLGSNGPLLNFVSEEISLNQLYLQFAKRKLSIRKLFTVLSEKNGYVFLIILQISYGLLRSLNRNKLNQAVRMWWCAHFVSELPQMQNCDQIAAAQNFCVAALQILSTIEVEYELQNAYFQLIQSLVTFAEKMHSQQKSESQQRGCNSAPTESIALLKQLLKIDSEAMIDDSQIQQTSDIDSLITLLESNQSSSSQPTECGLFVKMPESAWCPTPIGQSPPVDIGRELFGAEFGDLNDTDVTYEESDDFDLNVFESHQHSVSNHESSIRKAIQNDSLLQHQTMLQLQQRVQQSQALFDF